MKGDKSKLRSPRRGSYTMQELSRINRELDLMEQPTIYEKRALAGDFGVRKSAQVSHRSSEWIERRMRLQAQKRMVEQELIKLTELGEKVKVELTSNGKVALLKNDIIGCKEELPEGEYCLVSYDIPEELKTIRDRFRILLKQAGFEMIHFSLWRSSKNVVDKIQDFIKETGIHQWTCVTKVQL
ncbi:hypothetical protein KJ910_02555 [Patescibacteria group bacterium]|nr:hypothetical protein [Patescibacteria group bacterium]MBU1706026.1 hypothetical protein [Patescibacteria group bacterium]MBU1906896.1 hypothetical protein [Patescibacteria group bacterium]